MNQASLPRPCHASTLARSPQPYSGPPGFHSLFEQVCQLPPNRQLIEGLALAIADVVPEFFGDSCTEAKREKTDQLVHILCQVHAESPKGKSVNAVNRLLDRYGFPLLPAEKRPYEAVRAVLDSLSSDMAALHRQHAIEGAVLCQSPPSELAEDVSTTAVIADAVAGWKKKRAGQSPASATALAGTSLNTAATNG